MNILFIGNTEGTACALHYYTALLRLGFNVVPFNPYYFRADNLFEKLHLKLKRIPSQARIKKISDSIINICKRNQFDIIFNISENFLDNSTIEEVRKKSPARPLFLYHSHDNNFSDGIKKPMDFFETLKIYDFVFTTKSKNVEKYKSLGQMNAYFIPSAYEPIVHRPICGLESIYQGKVFDSVFIGTYDKSRDKFMEALGWQKIDVWGGFWEKYPSYSRYKSHIHPYPIYYFEFADVLSHCKVALGLLRLEADDLHTQRTFEIPACKALQIAPRNDEILSFFKEDEEIICFDSLEEFREKTFFYIKHEKLGEKIAEKGYIRCTSGKHTYVDRIIEMLKIVNKEERLSISLPR